MEEEQQLTIEGMPMGKSDKITIQNVALNKIKLNRNSRMNIDPEELSGLMSSIKEEGLLQPIGLVRNGSANHYEICYGNRRFLAVSKLGLAKIPAIIHNKKSDADIDIKNLTENIQRRNISLQEAGRYIEILKKGSASTPTLTTEEIAVRLGVTTHYVKTCSTAYNDVPEEFKNDLEIRVVNGKLKTTKSSPGKISISTANRIINSEKSGLINRAQAKDLFKSAKENENFNPSMVRNYAKALGQGKKNYVDAVGKMRHCTISFYVKNTHWEKLHNQYVENGPFNSVNGLFLAILEGKKNVKVELSRRTTGG